jgi:uncharacterized membrane protein YjgN (DUF898 family)
MDVMTNSARDCAEPISFNGRTGEFFGLALGNLLLTIITIGIYRFWGKTRVRRYLWEHTSFKGEPLEYLGRGIEKFIGAVIALVVLVVPIFVIAIVIGVLVAGGLPPALTILFYLPFYLGLFWLLGVAIYRSQRYMFSRTAWRGIRGGMRHRGYAFGWLYLKMLLLQIVTLGFAIPYTTTRLWNARMNDAMFGTLPVTADADWRPVFRGFLLSWFAALAIYVVMIGFVVASFGDLFAAVKPDAPPPADPTSVMADFLQMYAILLLGGLAVAIVMFRYYAAQLRALFNNTRIGAMALQFDVTGGDLLRFTVANLALIVFTLGLGIIMMPFRVYAFYARRLSTIGEIDMVALLQTDLAAPTQGDGLADAFDIGAF